MFDKKSSYDREDMTMSYHENGLNLKHENMSLFQNLKLKRQKAQDALDSRCSSDGESIVENSSCSPDSGSPGEATSPGHESSSYPSPELVRHSTGISTHHRLRLLHNSRTSPDSGGYNYPEIRSIDHQRGHPRMFDGGGDGFVSSTPMMLVDSRSTMDNYDDMSTSPPPPDTSDERKVDIQSTIHIAPLYAGTDEGCSLGAGGTGHGLIASVGPFRHRPSPPPSPLWTNGTNCGPFIDPREMRKLSIKHKSRGSSKDAIRDSEGLQSMFWTMNGQQNCHSHTSFSRSPREVLHSPRRYETSDAVRVSVDGLLSLGQDRKSPHQLSPSPTMRSPYPPSPSPSHYSSLVRVSSSGEMRNLSPSPSSSSFQFASQPKHSPLNMERLWAGEAAQSTRHLPKPDSALDLSKVDLWNGNGAVDSSGVPMHVDIEEDDQPMICMICDDKATGLHYGIITCEGCKGFFKRTVQNKRVYTCIAVGECEVTKVQRNRCQYCRFQKCLNQGMVLAAVREDRMPGGRNSGAVYNLYKVKYKKKNKNKNVHGRPRANTPDKIINLPVGYENTFMMNGAPLGPQINTSHSPISMSMNMSNHSSPLTTGGLISGNILKTALTNPAEVAHLRHRDNMVSSTRDRRMSLDSANSFIHGILKIEDSSDLPMIHGLDKLVRQHYATINEKLEGISDHVGSQLVHWIKRLPFYQGTHEHAALLTDAWPMLLILSSATHQAMFCENKLTSQGSMGDIKAECNLETTKHMYHLRRIECILRDDSDPEIRDDIQDLLEKFSEVVVSLRRLNIQMEEYVCLKVITLLKGDKRTEDYVCMREQYTECLRYFCESRYPSQHNRFQDVLVKLSEVNEAADLLVSTKAFYVPIMMCWNPDR